MRRHVSLDEGPARCGSILRRQNKVGAGADRRLALVQQDFVSPFSKQRCQGRESIAGESMRFVGPVHKRYTHRTPCLFISKSWPVAISRSRNRPENPAVRGK
jgi:hypothetical protein